MKYYKGYHGKPQKKIGSNRGNNNREYDNHGNNGKGQSEKWTWKRR